LADKKTILVTGSNGQLGSELRSLAGKTDSYNFLFTTREEMAIDDEDATTRYFSGRNIDYCVNCAAYTAVDKAES
jgi:dTDP-4-dehydrorhamnose reductase